MKRFLYKFILLGVMLIGLPMLGILLAGYPIERYLEFPPETLYVVHAPFSWIAFLAYTIFILVCVLPFIIKGLTSNNEKNIKKTSKRHRFPWWGWLGLIIGGVSWILAWTRFSWFAGLQPHTFTPLWLSLILVVNAVCYRQRGRCLMTERPLYFLLLFPLSAIFWWFFEYLNRFVQNWYYEGSKFGALEYFLYATPPFSTVLPAVLSMQYWIRDFSWFKRRFNNIYPINAWHPKLLAMVALAAACAGLGGIGVWPNYLFPLLWISPLLIVVSIQTFGKERHVLSDITKGNWELVISSAMAALFCGFFWEMWNYYSLAQWKYSVPFVHRFLIFEMPLLGYAGYLPFGLECIAMGKLLEEVLKP